MSYSKLNSITKDQLNNLISTSHSFFQVLQGLGYTNIYDKRTMERVKKKCLEYDIDYSKLREDRSLEKLVCSNCQRLLPITEFHQSNGKVHHLCKECKKQYQNEHYLNNINELNEYKASRSCKKCGENRFYLLDFHHINPDEKDYGIARRAHTNLSTLMPEINKCVVLCANCHREFHYLQEKNKDFTLEEYLDA